MGLEYASTVVSALSARSAVGHQSASTVVDALGAKIATRRNSSFIRPKGSRGRHLLPVNTFVPGAKVVRSSHRVLSCVYPWES